MVNRTLTAKTDTAGTVHITGKTTKHVLAHGDPATPFHFTLKNNTNPKQKVSFVSLDTQDNRSTCPPTVSGLHSSQIPANQVKINTASAKFVDNNDNKGAMDVCFRWNFVCEDGQKPVFDPIIDNRGR